jgi:hypothetical protein
MIETLTEEERHLAEEAISDVEASEHALSKGTDVGRPELAQALRKMQAAYTALVIERGGQWKPCPSDAIGSLLIHKSRQLLTQLDEALGDPELPAERRQMAKARIEEAIFNLEMAMARASKPRPGEEAL